MNYTKGEWKAYCRGSEGYQVRRNNDGVPAAKVKEELKERLTPIVYEMGGSFETQKANAHLIAAAPTMYEALKEILQYFDLPQNRGIFTRWERKMKIALAKAEGGG